MGPLIFALFAIMMAIGVPIAICLGLSSVATLLITGQYPYVAGIHRFISGIDSYVSLAIPFFILAAALMNTGGITKKLFRFANSIVCWIPGNLGHANVVASVIFAGMSGSAVADAGGLGQIEMEAMTEEGYDADFSAAVTSASSTIGPIIPPSIPMVVYGAMAEVSIGALFMAGIMPGIMMAVTMMILIYIMSKKRNYPKTTFSMKEVVVSFKEAFLSLMTPVIILGGMLTGFFTPTEAAAIAVVYAFVLSVFWYKEIDAKTLYRVILNSAVNTATITFILGSAAAFAWVIAIEGIPQALTGWLLAVTQNPLVILLLLNLALLVVGMFMEALAALTILVPFLVPLATAIGVDKVHLGLIIILNLMIGLCTPPVGMSLFVCSKYEGVSLQRLYKEILPFLVPLFIVLLLITYIPGIVLWLPNLLIG